MVRYHAAALDGACIISGPPNCLSSHADNPPPHPLFTGEKFIFPCGKWLARNEDDGQTERVLPVLGANGMVADTTTYTIRVHTGDVKGAGTDANVYLYLYGEQGDSGRLELRKSETYRNPFERNRIDVFTRELMDIGNLKRVVVGHDNSGLLGGAWFLDKVGATAF